MYVFMYEGMYVCMYVCMYDVCMYVCMHVCRLFACMHACMHVFFKPTDINCVCSHMLDSPASVDVYDLLIWTAS